MKSLKYYTQLWDSSGFTKTTDVSDVDFPLVNATANDQMPEYFPPSSWGLFNADSFAIRSVAFALYERFGVLAMATFKSVYSEGILWDLDITFHDTGVWMVSVCEIDSDDPLAISWTTDEPLHDILEMVESGLVKQCRDRVVASEIEELTK